MQACMGLHSAPEAASLLESWPPVPPTPSPRCLAHPPARQQQSRRQAAAGRPVACSAAAVDLDALLGPNAAQLSSSGTRSYNGAPENREEAVHAVDIESEAGVSYEALRDHLAAGEFQAADDETRALLIRLAGPDAESRKWVYFTEVKFIPAKDLRVLDQLWRAASGNKFGYGAQREVFGAQRQEWKRFFRAIDWTYGDNNYYRKWPQGFTYSQDAVKGHLPLTNCLRGTQLFRAIMEHPAFERPKPPQQPSSGSGSSSNGAGASSSAAALGSSGGSTGLLL